MKIRKFVIAAGIALLVVAFVNRNTLSVQADVTSRIKSTGVISYNNNTPDDTSDDAYFDASDLVTLENRLKAIEAKIIETENQVK